MTFTGRADLVDALSLAGVRRSHPIVPVLSDAVEASVGSMTSGPFMVAVRHGKGHHYG